MKCFMFDHKFTESSSKVQASDQSVQRHNFLGIYSDEHHCTFRCTVYCKMLVGQKTLANPNDDYISEKILAITDIFVMYKFSIRNSIHLPYVHMLVHLIVNFSTSAFANSIVFEDIFSLRGQAMICLQYFNHITIEELKLAERFTYSHIFNSHHMRESYLQ